MWSLLNCTAPATCTVTLNGLPTATMLGAPGVVTVKELSSRMVGVPGVVVTGVVLAGVELAGVVLAGVDVSGVLEAGVLEAGVEDVVVLPPVQPARASTSTSVARRSGRIEARDCAGNINPFDLRWRYCRPTTMMTRPPLNTRMVPEDDTTMASALEERVMLAAAMWRPPRPDCTSTAPSVST